MFDFSILGLCGPDKTINFSLLFESLNERKDGDWLIPFQISYTWKACCWNLFPLNQLSSAITYAAAPPRQSHGKPVYPGSNKWLYYTTSDKYNMVKLPFSHNGRKCDSDYGCDELYDGDIVQLPAYNGSFKVSVYQLDKPRYIPYVY